MTRRYKNRNVYLQIFFHSNDPPSRFVFEFAQEPARNERIPHVS